MQAKTTREKIIQDCLGLVATRGFNGTSMADISEKAAILRGSFYNYFKNKEEFISAVLDSYAEQWEKGVFEVLRNRTMSAKARFAAFFERMKQMTESMQFSQGCFAGNLSQEMSGVSDKFASQVEKVFSRVQSHIAAALKEAQENGQLSQDEDANTLAEIILNSIEGAILREKSARSSRPIEILSEFFLRKFTVQEIS